MFGNRSLSTTQNVWKNQTELVITSNKIDLKPKSPKRRKPKRFVPEAEKDAHYWEKRKWNNLQSRRAKKAKKERDNQATATADLLQSENAKLKNQINDIRKQILEIREKNQFYVDLHYIMHYGPFGRKFEPIDDDSTFIDSIMHNGEIFF